MRFRYEGSVKKDLSERLKNRLKRLGSGMESSLFLELWRTIVSEKRGEKRVW